MKNTLAKVGTTVVCIVAAVASVSCEAKTRSKTSSDVIVGKEDRDPSGYLNDYLYLVADRAGKEQFCWYKITSKDRFANFKDLVSQVNKGTKATDETKALGVTRLTQHPLSDETVLNLFRSKYEDRTRKLDAVGDVALGITTVVTGASLFLGNIPASFFFGFLSSVMTGGVMVKAQNADTDAKEGIKQIELARADNSKMHELRSEFETLADKLSKVIAVADSKNTGSNLPNQVSCPDRPRFE